jgi:hypothetical protein
MSVPAVSHFVLGLVRGIRREALLISRLEHGVDSEDIANDLVENRHYCLLDLAQSNKHIVKQTVAQAMAISEEALGIFRRLHGRKHPGVASALGSTAEQQLELGELDEAVQLYNKVVRLDITGVWPSSGKVGRNSATDPVPFTPLNTFDPFNTLHHNIYHRHLGAGC